MNLVQLERKTHAPMKRRRKRTIANVVHSGVVDPYRPLLAQIVVTRRCNLSCSYCYEYDKVSKPVPTEVLRTRFQHLARLKTVFVTLNGGEPLLHPEVPTLVRAINSLGMTPMMNSNGFLWSERMVHALNDAGLYGVQISVDSIHPTAASQKSLKTLMPKLQHLQRHARFIVRVNTVLGPANAPEALEVARTAQAMGFDTQCSLLRDARGQVMPLGEEAQSAYEEIRRLKGRLPAHLHDDFQLPLARGETIDWKCRSGARYFHVCEDGLVHLCQPRAGNPGVPLEDYQRADIKRAFHAKKECASRCPHAYAHIGSRMDSWRGQRGDFIARLPQ